ncbi:MAG: dihydroorotate dehydrogenase electron transfer subunit [Deltaproteobacteria bacterium]|nr:dihydroorotate dehydrogenase electron transfer subunit [Candidatus Zymogenaceae bacterium]
MKAKVVSNKEVSPGLFRLSLAGGERLTTGRPGQFVMVRGVWGADPLLSRPFSVYRYRSSIDVDGTIQLLIKRVGRGTELFSRVVPGEELTVQGPLGNGFPKIDVSGRLFLAGGGIGVAPMMSVAESLAGEELKRTRLIFGGKAVNDVSGIDEDISDVGVETIFVTEDGGRGRAGTVVDVLKDELTPSDVVFACGPREMLRAVATLAGEKDCRAFISHEERMACGVGLCLGCAVPKASGEYALTCTDGPVFVAQSILWEEL